MTLYHIATLISMGLNFHSKKQGFRPFFYLVIPGKEFRITIHKQKMAAVPALFSCFKKPIHAGTAAINSQQPSKSKVILSPLIMVKIFRPPELSRERP